MNLVHPYKVLGAVIHQPLKELLVVLLWLPLEVVDLEETGRSHLSTLQAFNHQPNILDTHTHCPRHQALRDISVGQRTSNGLQEGDQVLLEHGWLPLQPCGLRRQPIIHGRRVPGQHVIQEVTVDVAQPKVVFCVHCLKVSFQISAPDHPGGIEPCAPWPCPETLPLSYGSLPGKC